MSINFTLARVRAMAAFLTYLTCLLMACISAMPICKGRLKFDEIGLCSSNGSFTKWHCPFCPHGSGQLVECGRMYEEGTKVGCSICKTGTYSDTNDISQCKQCRRCQKNENKTGQCLSDKDNVQCTCKQDFYRDKQTRDCKPCSWCCGDKTNRRVPECNVPQVPPEKQCSLQTVKECAPTTPAPITTVPTTTPTTVPTTIPTTIPNATTPSTNFTTTETSSSTTLDPPVIENKSTDHTGKSEDNESDRNILLPVIAVLVFFLVVFIAVYRYQKRNSNSSDGDSAQTSRSTSTANELNSSELLLPGDEDKEIKKHNCTVIYIKEGDEAACQSGNQVKMNHSQKPTENNSLELEPMMPSITQSEHNSAEEDPLLTEPGNQVKVEDSASGPSTDESVPIVTNTPNIENYTEKLGELSKEQKLDMPVAQLPLGIYSKVCTRLDTVDPFFHDYRMLAEELGVSKEEIHVLQKNQTDSLLVKYKPKVRKLIKILEKINKEYLIEDIEAWLNQC